jgi:2-iminobutanoate/2-iminopropanoate deaminase
MNAVYAGYFKDKPLACARVQVARLPRDSLIQIVAITARETLQNPGPVRVA